MPSLPEERRRWGNMYSIPAYRIPHSNPQSGFAADRRAMMSDWQKVGDYLWGALRGDRNDPYPALRALLEMRKAIKEAKTFAASIRAKAWDEMRRAIEEAKQR